MIQFSSFSLYNNFSLQGSFWILDGQDNDADIKVFSLKIIMKDEMSNILGVKVMIACNYASAEPGQRWHRHANYSTCLFGEKTLLNQTVSVILSSYSCDDSDH